jgi:hypothetical protein
MVMMTDELEHGDCRELDKNPQLAPVCKPEDLGK